MKRETTRWVRKAEQDWEVAHKLAGETPPPRDVVCFHCQQAAEKYLKALLQENGLVVPKTHDLVNVLNLLLPGDAARKDLGQPVHPDREQNTGAQEPEHTGPRGVEVDPARDRDGDQHADLQRRDRERDE